MKTIIFVKKNNAASIQPKDGSTAEIIDDLVISDDMDMEKFFATIKDGVITLCNLTAEISVFLLEPLDEIQKGDDGFLCTRDDSGHVKTERFYFDNAIFIEHFALPASVDDLANHDGELSEGEIEETASTVGSEGGEQQPGDNPFGHQSPKQGGTGEGESEEDLRHGIERGGLDVYKAFNKQFLLVAWCALSVTMDDASNPPEPILRTSDNKADKSKFILKSKQFKQFKQAYIQAFMAKFALSAPLPDADALNTMFPKVKAKDREMQSFIESFLASFGCSPHNCLFIERNPKWEGIDAGPTASGAELLQFARLFYPSTRISIDGAGLFMRHNKTRSVNVMDPMVSKEILLPGAEHKKKKAPEFTAVTTDSVWNSVLNSHRQGDDKAAIAKELDDALMYYARRKVSYNGDLKNLPYKTLGAIKDAYLEAVYRYFDTSNTGLTADELDRDAYYLLQHVESSEDHVLKYRRNFIKEHASNTISTTRYQRFMSHLAHVSPSARSFMADKLWTDVKTPNEPQHKLLTDTVVYQVRTPGFKSTVKFSKQGEMKHVLSNPAQGENLHYYVTKTGVQYTDVVSETGALAERSLDMLTGIFTSGLTKESPSIFGRQFDKKTYVERVAHYFDPAHHDPKYHAELERQMITFVEDMVANPLSFSNSNKQVHFSRQVNVRAFDAWNARAGLTNAYKDLLLFFAGKFASVKFTPSDSSSGETNMQAFIITTLKAAYDLQKSDGFFKQKLLHKGHISPTYLKIEGLSVNINNEGRVSMRKKNQS